MTEKRRIKVIRVIIVYIILSFVLCLICLTGCGVQMKNYYKNDKNYSTLDGIYNNFTSSELIGEYLNITYVIDNENIEHSFRLLESSYSVLQKNGFFDEVQKDSGITFTTGFNVWCSGCHYVLAEIWCNDKCYLDFETGKANILQAIENGARRF